MGETEKADIIICGFLICFLMLLEVICYLFCYLFVTSYSAVHCYFLSEIIWLILVFVVFLFLMRTRIITKWIINENIFET